MVSEISDLSLAKEKSEAQFIARNPKSNDFHCKACDSLPGGNTRTVLHGAPFPIFIEAGYGSKLRDVDGHEYTDFLNELTAGIYGHSNPVIKKALMQGFDEIGISLGGTTTCELNYAEALKSRFLSIEKIRFCNSGTEANITAIIAARKFTGKRAVIAMHGGYHGGPLSFAHGISPYNMDSQDFILCEYNNSTQFKELVNSSQDIAAVIVEAMQGAGGAIPADKEFMQTIQLECEKNDIVFILDEVMTSRLSPGGLQQIYCLKPDLTTLGKYLGGGLPFGAFGGRADIMSCFDPRLPGSLSHSGTFNNDTLTLTAGYVGLTELYTPEAVKRLNALGDGLRKDIESYCHNTKMSITGLGSIMNIHFTESGRVNSYNDTAGEVIELKDLLWMDLLKEGFWIARRGMITLSLVLTESELEAFKLTIKAWIHRRMSLIRI